ncbi:MAG: D-alanyl-D-alanine carboxypeptidase family protein [Pikeienuella sp.]|uniref:D-alanyl-D-alanine carboxypeptidase family protein n=1 Tax=Pikeienuella sp. TaxID=2831957 RepID=UPI00391D1ACF
MTRLPALFAALALLAQPAAAFDTAARAAIVIDMTSGAVLLEKDADKPLPPASMSKLMTLNMVFEALQQGRLSLDDTFPVSEKAWKMGGSRMFVRAGDRIRVEDLLRGVIVQSGNDACVVLAEGLAGSEEAFAARMNERAKELGLANSHFTNSTGWPDPDHYMSVRDLMTLIDRMVNAFPEYYPMWAETDFEWDGVAQRNRNPLLYLDLGADGLKTGHTEEAGFGLTGSAIRDGRRIGFVVTGLDSMGDRAQESERLLTWAFREFRTERIASAGQIVGEAEVWVGEERTVPLTPAQDVIATAPWAAAAETKVTIRYDGPIPAPIAAGQPLGELVVEAAGLPPVRAPLVAAVAVEKGGLITRVGAAVETLLRGSDAPEAAE